MTETVESTTYQTIATTVVTKTQIGNDVVLPKWCRQIVSIKPILGLDVPTAAESCLTKYSIESDDIAGLAPFEVFGTPIGATLGATLSAFQAAPETYFVGAATQGGERLRCYCQALVANTGALVVAMEIRISDQPPQFPQRHAKIGTLTSSGTTATSDVAGTAYQITGGHAIKELQAVFAHTTVAAASAVVGYFKYSSSEFGLSMPVKMQINPIAASVGALDITYLNGVTRDKVDIPIANNTTLQDALYMGLAPTVAGNFATGVIYE